MKSILCMVAAISLVTPVAFAQTGTQRDFVERAPRALLATPGKPKSSFFLAPGTLPSLQP